MTFDGELTFLEQIKDIVKELQAKGDLTVCKVTPKYMSKERVVFVFLFGEREETDKVSNFLKNYGDHLMDSIFVVDGQLIVIKKYLDKKPEKEQDMLQIQLECRKKLNNCTDIVQNHTIHATLNWDDTPTIMPEIREYFKDTYAYDEVKAKISLVAP